VSASPALLVAAAGVGFGHAVLPDHWLPLALVGRTQRYSLAKVARLSGLAAAAHVVVSLLLGTVIVVIGLRFRSRVEHAQNASVGLLLIATGVWLLAGELMGRGHGHAHRRAQGHSHAHPHSHAHRHGTADHPQSEHSSATAGRSRLSSLAQVVVPFGAAASPDLTILPVFLAATSVGVGTAVGSLLVFAAITIATIVGLTLFATAGGAKVRVRWLDRWGNVLTAATLATLGVLVLIGVF